MLVFSATKEPSEKTETYPTHMSKLNCLLHPSNNNLWYAVSCKCQDEFSMKILSRPAPSLLHPLLAVSPLDCGLPQTSLTP